MPPGRLTPTSTSAWSATTACRLQALYGPPPQDTGNASIATAAKLSQDQTPGSRLLAADGDLGNPQDLAFYQLNLTGSSGPVTVQLQTAGISLLAARLSILDQDGQVLASTSAADPGTDLTLSLTPASKTKTLYVEVQKAADNAFAIGSYHLQVDPGSHGSGGGSNSSSGPHGNNGQSPVISLQARRFRDDGRFAYLYQGVLTDTQPSAAFRFQAANPSSGNNVMTVMVWSTDGSAARPVATLTDTSGNVVPAQVLQSEPGVFVLQVPDAPHDAPYLLNVSSAAGGPLGSYTLAVNFDDVPTPLDTLLSDQVQQTAAASDVGTLQIDQSQLFHLVLTTQPSPGADQTLVLEVLDQTQTVVSTLAVEAGGAISATPFLAPGTYQVVLSGEDSSGNWVPLTFSLFGAGLTDPIGPPPDPNRTIPQSGPGDADGTATYRWQTGLTGILQNPASTSSASSSTGTSATAGTSGPGPASGSTGSGATSTTSSTPGSTGTSNSANLPAGPGSTASTPPAATQGNAGISGSATTGGVPSSSSGNSPSAPSSTSATQTATPTAATGGRSNDLTTTSQGLATTLAGNSGGASPAVVPGVTLVQILTADGRTTSVASSGANAAGPAASPAADGGSAAGTVQTGLALKGNVSPTGDSFGKTEGDTTIAKGDSSRDVQTLPLAPNRPSALPEAPAPRMEEPLLADKVPLPVDLPGTPGQFREQSRIQPRTVLPVLAEAGANPGGSPEKGREETARQSNLASIRIICIGTLVALLGVLRLFPAAEARSSEPKRSPR